MVNVLIAGLLCAASLADIEAQRAKAQRVVAARGERLEAVKKAFAAVSVPYPPREIFLRAFKQERKLELWARGAGDYVRVMDFDVCAASGDLGPKRKRGDMQVPEGFYVIDRFNPTSNFELSLGLDYPNASDRALKDGDDPGGDIFIHGSCVSIGCMAIVDEIRSLYTVAIDTYVHSGGKAIPVHVFPLRMNADGMRVLTEKASGNPALLDFWRSLEPGFTAFEATKKVPKVRVHPTTHLYELVR
jgi:murein L,D-transpeptidase YafK